MIWHKQIITHLQYQNHFVAQISPQPTKTAVKTIYTQL